MIKVHASVDPQFVYERLSSVPKPGGGREEVWLSGYKVLFSCMDETGREMVAYAEPEGQRRVCSLWYWVSHFRRSR